MPNENSNMLKKSRIDEIDTLLKEITHEVEQHHDFMSKTELEFSLITAKVKREKVNVLAAIAKSHMLLANMDILIAESDLRSDLERLRNYQLKLKLEHNTGKTHKTSGSTKKRNKSPSSQSSNPKKRKKSSDAPKPSPADISSDETVIIETLPVPISVESLHDCLTQLPKLDSPTVSEISLPSFIKAEFNNPYEESDNQTHKKTESKGKSSITKHQLTVTKPKTVSEINKTFLDSKSNNSKDSSSSHTPKSSRQKSDDRRETPSTSTFVPIKHKMPAVVTQAKNYYGSSSTTVMSLSQNKPDNVKPDTAPNIKYFGSKQ